MADIKQAAKWMEEGRKVARLAHPDRILHCDRWNHVTDVCGLASFICAADLLADDWEAVSDWST